MKRLDDIQAWIDDGGNPTQTDAEWLIARVKELTAALRLTEFAGDFCDEAACPVCLSRYFKKHAKNCIVGKALRSVDEQV